MTTLFLSLCLSVSWSDSVAKSKFQRFERRLMLNFVEVQLAICLSCTVVSASPSATQWSPLARITSFCSSSSVCWLRGNRMRNTPDPAPCSSQPQRESGLFSFLPYRSASLDETGTFGIFRLRRKKKKQISPNPAKHEYTHTNSLALSLTCGFLAFPPPGAHGMPPRRPSPARGSEARWRALTFV